MNRQIYRQEALERMGSPEQLDQLMALTSPRAWLALAAVGILLAWLVAWSILGRVTTSVEGDGVLVRLGGVHSVTAPRDAAVGAVLVQTGQPVQPGDVLMELLAAGADGQGETTPVASPIAGRVLNLGVYEGDIVKARTILATVESTDRPLQAVLYVPAGDGYTVRPGRAARIVPATSQKGNVRYLHGRVASAGKFPATQNEMMYTLQNTEWTNRVLSMGPTLEVIVEPVGEDWSTHLYSGIPCHGSITTAEHPPISLVFPMFESQSED